MAPQVIIFILLILICCAQKSSVRSYNPTLVRVPQKSSYPQSSVKSSISGPVPQQNLLVQQNVKHSKTSSTSTVSSTYPPPGQTKSLQQNVKKQIKGSSSIGTDGKILYPPTFKGISSSELQQKQQVQQNANKLIKSSSGIGTSGKVLYSPTTVHSGYEHQQKSQVPQNVNKQIKGNLGIGTGGKLLYPPTSTDVSSSTGIQQKQQVQQNANKQIKGSSDIGTSGKVLYPLTSTGHSSYEHQKKSQVPQSANKHIKSSSEISTSGKVLYPPTSTGHSGYQPQRKLQVPQNANKQIKGSSDIGTGGKFLYPRTYTGYSGYGQQQKPQDQNVQYKQNIEFAGIGIDVKVSYPNLTSLIRYGQQLKQNIQHKIRHSGNAKHKFHYQQPHQIVYSNSNLPVYQGELPDYIYEYCDSGSRFDTLLNGLALYNLGKWSTIQSDYYGDYTSLYPGEKCKLGVNSTYGNYEDALIDCKLISSFIWEAQNVPKKSDTTMVTRILGSFTTINALSARGPSVKVTKGMQCSLFYSSISDAFKKTIDCGLLQAYAMSSLRRSNSNRMLLSNNLLIASIFSLYLYLH